jgi:hypothetical protein
MKLSEDAFAQVSLLGFGVFVGVFWLSLMVALFCGFTS